MYSRIATTIQPKDKDLIFSAPTIAVRRSMRYVTAQGFHNTKQNKPFYILVVSFNETRRMNTICQVATLAEKELYFYVGYIKSGRRNFRSYRLISHETQIC